MLGGCDNKRPAPNTEARREGQRRDSTMDMKKLIAGTALAATLVVGIGGVSYAADSSTANAPAVTSQTATAAKHPGLARRVRRAAFKTVLDQTHTTAADLKAALLGGQTVAQYAAAHGSSGQAVHDALVTKFSAAIDKAVSNARITQAKADTMKQNLSSRIDKFVDRTWTKA